MRLGGPESFARVRGGEDRGSEILNFPLEILKFERHGAVRSVPDFTIKFNLPDVASGEGYSSIFTYENTPWGIVLISIHSQTIPRTTGIFAGEGI